MNTTKILKITKKMKRTLDDILLLEDLLDDIGRDDVQKKSASRKLTDDIDSDEHPVYDNFIRLVFKQYCTI